MAAVAYCGICFENRHLEHFRVLPCGHGYCTECTENLAGTSRHFNCPNCRTKIPRAAPHKICLDIVDSKTFFATDVIDKLGQMGEATKLKSVETAVGKITKAAKVVKHDKELAEKLLKAIEDFKALVPGFQRAEKAEIEVERLQKTIQENQGQLEAEAACRRTLKDKLDKLKDSFKLSVVELNQANDRLKKSAADRDVKLETAERERDEAISLAEKATGELLQMREANAKIAKSVEEMSETNKILKRQLEWYKSKYATQSNEITELKERWNDVQSKMAEKEQDLQSKLIEKEKENEDLTFTVQQSQYSSHNQWYARDHDDEGFDHNSLELEGEGIPRMQFGSGWQANKPRSNSTLRPKLKRPVSANGLNVSFPIKLDTKGRPLVPIQTGPRATKRVKI